MVCLYFNCEYICGKIRKMKLFENFAKKNPLFAFVMVFIIILYGIAEIFAEIIYRIYRFFRRLKYFLKRFFNYIFWFGVSITIVGIPPIKLWTGKIQYLPEWYMAMWMLLIVFSFFYLVGIKLSKEEIKENKNFNDGFLSNKNYNINNYSYRSNGLNGMTSKEVTKKKYEIRKKLTKKGII